jgi:heat-inducible transcriptional repressor
MADLTSRQIKILKSLIDEFIETARPVGSETLEKKYNFGVCPATLRNEMAKLTQMGYLTKEHSSAGRIPTSMSLKFYVRELMTPRRLSVSEEVGVKEKILNFRSDFNTLLKEATKELSRRTQKMSLAVTIQGAVYHHGLSNLLDEPEFLDIDVTKTVLSLLDEVSFWLRLVENLSASHPSGKDDIHLLLGQDLGNEFLQPCGFIYQDYESGPYKGIIGIVGPARLHYSEIVPLINYFAEVLSEVGR